MTGKDLLQFIVAGLSSGALYALLALGFTIVYASTGVINFAQGEFYMLGGMLGVLAFDSLGIPLVFAALLAILATTAVGVLFELLAIRPRKDGDPLALIIITVGGSILIQSLTRHAVGGEELATLPSFSPGPSIGIAGVTIVRQSLWIWGITAVAVVGLTLLYRRTRFGKAMRACSIDRDGARLVGIDTARVVTASFALAAALGAIAGVVISPTVPPVFYSGASIGLKGFAAAILGGLGNPVAAVAGGLTLGLLENIASGFISSTFKDGIALVVLLGVLFVRPQGLFGGRSREKV